MRKKYGPFLPLIAALTLMLSFSGCAARTGPVSAYPEKTIQLIVPHTAGSANDRIARAMADALSKELPRSVVVVNIGGGSGAVGFTELYNAAPDGYTIGISSSAIVLNALEGVDTFDYDKFEYLMGVCYDPYLLLVAADSAFESLDDLIAYAKDRQLLIASGSELGYTHLTALDVISTAGLENCSVVPCDGNSERLLAITSGDCHATISSVSAAKGMLEAGAIRALCILWPERTPELPDVPTSDELGYPTLHHGPTHGFIAPPATPREILDILTEAMYRAVEREDYREAETSLGLNRSILSGEELKAEMEASYESYVRISRLIESDPN